MQPGAQTASGRLWIKRFGMEKNGKELNFA